MSYRKYAEGTEVPAARSKFELEMMLEKYGAGGQTISEKLMPELDKLCISGKMPKLLPEFK